ncbi:MAG: hypothetical protein IKL07_06345 [Clostridium sp.]|nr:hypothetical protein [Clostridium sp.]
MLIYVGTLLAGVTLVTFIIGFIKKQKKIRKFNWLIAGLAIAVNAGLCMYYNNQEPVIGGLGLGGLGKFVVTFIQTILVGILMLVMAICYRIQAKRER